MTPAASSAAAIWVLGCAGRWAYSGRAGHRLGGGRGTNTCGSDTYGGEGGRGGTMDEDCSGVPDFSATPGEVGISATQVATGSYGYRGDGGVTCGIGRFARDGRLQNGAAGSAGSGGARSGLDWWGDAGGSGGLGQDGGGGPGGVTGGAAGAGGAGGSSAPGAPTYERDGNPGAGGASGFVVDVLVVE